MLEPPDQTATEVRPFQGDDHSEQAVQRLRAELRRKDDEQRAILRIHRAASAHLGHDELLKAIAAAAYSVVPFCCMAVALPGVDDDALSISLVEIESEQLTVRPGLVVPSQGTVARWVLEYKESFIANALSDLRPFAYCFNECAKVGIESHCALPLIIRERPVGVLLFVGKEKNLYPTVLVPFLEELAAAVAVVLDNHRPYLGGFRLEDESAFSDVRHSGDQHTTETVFQQGIVGASRSIIETMQRIAMVAPTDSSVLISGETGTGKELVARAIYHLSRRSDKRLIVVNCAALPAGLAESELFGHEKGAFTGAVVRRAGRFELADGGTIFLDEVGDLPHDVQAKLLRVLQHGEFERVGGTKSLSVDARVIAATNHPLERAVASNLFRADLYYRLNVFPLHLPPLRERREDIAPLAEHLLGKYTNKLKKTVDTIDGPTMQRLAAYSWPGNVRELENVIERGVIISKGRLLELEDDLPASSTMSASPRPPVDVVGTGRSEEATPRHDAERLLNALALTGGNHSRAARLLGIGRTTLWRKLKLHGLTCALVSVGSLWNAMAA